MLTPTPTFPACVHCDCLAAWKSLTRGFSQTGNLTGLKMGVIRSTNSKSDPLVVGGNSLFKRKGKCGYRQFQRMSKSFERAAGRINNSLGWSSLGLDVDLVAAFLPLSYAGRFCFRWNGCFRESPILPLVRKRVRVVKGQTNHGSEVVQKHLACQWAILWAYFFWAPTPFHHLIFLSRIYQSLSHF